MQSFLDHAHNLVKSKMMDHKDRCPDTVDDEHASSRFCGKVSKKNGQNQVPVLLRYSSDPAAQHEIKISNCHCNHSLRVFENIAAMSLDKILIETEGSKKDKNGHNVPSEEPEPEMDNLLMKLYGGDDAAANNGKEEDIAHCTDRSSKIHVSTIETNEIARILDNRGKNGGAGINKLGNAGAEVAFSMMQ